MNLNHIPRYLLFFCFPALLVGCQKNSTGLEPALLLALGNSHPSISSTGSTISEPIPAFIPAEEDKTARVLFVDDDRGLDAQDSWHLLLTELNVIFDYEVVARDGNTTRDLADYKLVIWSTGDDFLNNLTLENVETLSTYLDQGGALLYAGGQNVYDEQHAAEFLRNYLGITRFSQNLASLQDSLTPAFGDWVLNSENTSTYTLNSWENSFYKKNFSLFEADSANALPLLKPQNTNLLVTNTDTFYKEYLAVFFAAEGFKSLIWGFDINHIQETERKSLLLDSLMLLAPAVLKPEPDPDLDCSPSNLVQNGSFEDPILNGNWDVFSSAEIPGWNVEWVWPELACSLAAGDIVSQPVLELQHKNGGNSSAVQGNQYAELDSDCFGPSGHGNGLHLTSVDLSQTLKTRPGFEYEVSFWVRRKPGHQKLDPMLLQVNWQNTKLEHSLKTPKDWTQFTYRIEADSENTTLRFRDLGLPNGRGIFLDDVKVVGCSR